MYKRQIHSILNHRGAVGGGLDPDILVLRHHVEVLLHTAAASDNFDIGAASLFDSLQHADGSLVIHGEHSVDLSVGSQHVGEVRQASLTRELGSVGDHIHVGSDLSDLIFKALLTELGNRAGGGNIQHHHSAGGCLLYTSRCV